MQYICYWTSVWFVLGKYWSSFCSEVHGLGRFFGKFMDWAAGAVHKLAKKRDYFISLSKQVLGLYGMSVFLFEKNGEL